MTEFRPLHCFDPLLYGVAWKGDRTKELVRMALVLGFKGVDTANFPAAYNEPQTGEAIAAAINSGIKRESLFIQTKYSPRPAQRTNIALTNRRQYIKDQIKTSIEDSLQYLEVDYLDAVLLHAPFERMEDTYVAWNVLESFVPHTVRYLGISNTSLPILQAVYKNAQVKPAIVQNRFHKETHFDNDVRAFCKAQNILYQAYGVLRSNSDLLVSEVVASVAQSLGVEKELALYVLVLCLGGIQILDGTTQPQRMRDDLKIATEISIDQQRSIELDLSVKIFEKLLADKTDGSLNA